MSLKKIFIDATGIVKIPTGLGKYSYYLLKAMLRNGHFKYRLTVLHQLDLPRSHPLFDLKDSNLNFLAIKTPVIGPHRDLGLYKLRKVINQHHLFHCLSSYMPAFGINIPSVVTIHDLKYLLFPEFFNNRLKTLYYSWVIRRGIRNANRVIAISRATKNDLINLHVPTDKIVVIHEAATISLKETKRNFDLTEIVVDKPFFFFVGDNRPHKNINRIIQAYCILREKLGAECPPFVFAGPNFDVFHRKYQFKKYSKGLVFCGPVLEPTLIGLYKQALALVYPSLYEGFGLPILEAMAMGVPVITSNCSSMPEVAAQAAIQIDPHDANQLANAMMRIVKNESERKRIIQLGIRRVKEFSWEKAAEMTSRLYEGILSRGSHEDPQSNL
jgi:glycosyltransferase involved in cell wall biosynthesis